MVALRPFWSIPAILNLPFRFIMGATGMGQRGFFMSNEIEEWRDIPGYEGYYQVSSFGRMIRNKRDIFHKTRCGNIAKYTLSEKIIKLKENKYGYIVPILSKNQKKKRISLHKLVAMCFLDGYNDSYDIDHINGNRSDNRVSNLRYCTRSENLRGSKKRKNATSKYKGVHFSKRYMKHEAFSTSISQKMKKVCLGVHESEEEAAKAVDKYVREHYCEYGRYNFPMEGERGIN